MKRIVILLFILLVRSGSAQEVKQLWQGVPPHYKPNTLKEAVKEAWGVPCAYFVTKPTLTLYRAQGDNSGRAMIIMPGGGYEDHDVVPIEESQVYAKALAAAGQAVEVHFFAKGGHGFGPGKEDNGTAQWLGLLANWIKRQ